MRLGPGGRGASAIRCERFPENSELVTVPEPVDGLAMEELQTEFVCPGLDTLDGNIVDPLAGNDEVVQSIRGGSPVGPAAHVLVE